MTTQKPREADYHPASEANIVPCVTSSDIRQFVPTCYTDGAYALYAAPHSVRAGLLQGPRLTATALPHGIYGAGSRFSRANNESAASG